MVESVIWDAGGYRKFGLFVSLGVYTIWLMAIHPSPSQHGFGVIDCFGMNPIYCDYRCEPMGWYSGQKGA